MQTGPVLRRKRLSLISCARSVDVPAAPRFAVLVIVTSYHHLYARRRQTRSVTCLPKRSSAVLALPGCSLKLVPFVARPSAVCSNVHSRRLDKPQRVSVWRNWWRWRRPLRMRHHIDDSVILIVDVSSWLHLAKNEGVSSVRCAPKPRYLCLFYLWPRGLRSSRSASNDSIAQLVRLGHVVGREQDRGSLVPKFFEHAPEAQTTLRVQPHGRLVEEENQWAMANRPGDL
jgi:hypothetical protein